MAAALEDLLRSTATGSLSVHSGSGAPVMSLTKEALMARARSVAGALVMEGVAEGDLVAITLGNDTDAVVGLVAVWLAGATAASLPRIHRGVPGSNESLEELLWSTRCRFHLTSRKGSPRFDDIADRNIGQLEESSSGPGPERAMADDALVQFTSGSVGRPKGVVVTSRALADHVDALAQVMMLDPERDSFASWLPLSHDMGLVGTCLVPLCLGLPLHLMSPREFVTHPQRWLELTAATQSTILVGPDFGWRLAAMAAGAGDRIDLSSVRIAISGGERVRRTTVESMEQRLGPLGLAWEAITPTYGMAEACLAVTFSGIGAGPTYYGGDVGLGRALPGVAVRTEDNEMLSVRTSHGFRGYLGSDGVTDARDEAGWYSTGDAGAFVDGDLVVRGRVDEVVVAAGRNLYAEDVELVLLDEFDGELAGVGAFRSADEGGRFGLVVELHDGVDLDDELRRRIRTTMVGALETRPASIDSVALGSLPRTTSGKVRRGECRELVERRTVGSTP